MNIGEIVYLGWNGAKRLCDNSVAYSDVWVEAVGVDWVVVRDETGVAHAATFCQGEDMREVLTS